MRKPDAAPHAPTTTKNTARTQQTNVEPPRRSGERAASAQAEATPEKPSPARRSTGDEEAPRGVAAESHSPQIMPTTKNIANRDAETPRFEAAREESSAGEEARIKDGAHVTITPIDRASDYPTVTETATLSTGRVVASASGKTKLSVKEIPTARAGEKTLLPDNELATALPDSNFGAEEQEESEPEQFDVVIRPFILFGAFPIISFHL